MSRSETLMRYLLYAGAITGLIYTFAPNPFPIFPFQRVLAPAEIGKNGPRSYYVKLKPMAPFSFSPDDGARIRDLPPFDTRPINTSVMEVLEDGLPNGPAHAPHKDIAELGAGRYSHWKGKDGEALIFSASDNTDPRSNGHVYLLKGRYDLPLIFLVVALMPLSLFLVRKLERRLVPHLDIGAEIDRPAAVVVDAKRICAHGR